MIDTVTNEMKVKMNKIIDDLKKNFVKIRTGRASLSILDNVTVEFYGIENHINQLATLSVPDSRSIMIAPWDVSAIPAIEKAILKSELGITPQNDGKTIRIVIPPLNEERRKDLAKQIKKIAEEHKVTLRTIRHKYNDEIKKLLKDKTITEDDSFKSQKKNQEITESFEKMINEIEHHKEKEIMEV